MKFHRLQHILRLYEKCLEIDAKNAAIICFHLTQRHGKANKRILLPLNLYIKK